MFAKRLRNQTAQGMVEFAAIATPLVLLLLGIMEFGRAFYAYSTIANAASEGVRYGITDAKNDTCIKSIVKHYSPILGLTDANISISPAAASRAFGIPLGIAVQYSFVPVAPLLPSLNFTGASTMTVVY